MIIRLGVGIRLHLLCGAVVFDEVIQAQLRVQFPEDFVIPDIPDMDQQLEALRRRGWRGVSSGHATHWRVIG